MSPCDCDPLVSLWVQIMGRFKSAVADSSKPSSVLPVRTELSVQLQMQVALKVRTCECVSLWRGGGEE